MSEKRNDPIAIWQTMIGEMEKGFNAFTGRTTAPSEIGKPGEATSGAQPRLGDLMEKYLVNMNMPSRSQMVSIADRLQSIESQLDKIKALLLQTQKTAAAPEAGLKATPEAKATPKPPRSKRPPPAGDEQK